MASLEYYVAISKDWLCQVREVYIYIYINLYI